MRPEWDIYCAYALFGLQALIGLAYALRSYRLGSVRYDRVEKQGNSALLSKDAMNMVYWSLQPVGRACVALHISSNALSWLSFALGLAAGGAIAVGAFGLGALLAAFSSLADSLDGMVARLNGTASDAGEVLDAAVDRYVEYFFCAGLVLFYNDYFWLQVLAMGALCACFMVSYSSAKAEALNISLEKGGLRRPERAVYMTLGAALSAISIHFFENPTVVLAYPMIVVMAMITVVGNLSAAKRLYELASKVRARDAAQQEQQSQADSLAKR